MQILEIPAQRKFVLSVYHAHSNAHNRPYRQSSSSALIFIYLNNFNKLTKILFLLSIPIYIPKTKKNAIVWNLFYQIPFTQLRGPQGRWKYASSKASL